MAAPALAPIVAKHVAAKYGKHIVLFVLGCFLVIPLLTTAAYSAFAVAFYSASAGNTVVAVDGWANPLKGPLTSSFGPRSCVAGQCGPHTGQDISAAMYTPFYAAHAAVVVSITVSDGGITTWDEENHLVIMYWHAEHITVKVGQHITAGELIGLVGSKGNSTGPHLHFEIRAGANRWPGTSTPIDPYPFMKERGIILGQT